MEPNKQISLKDALNEAKVELEQLNIPAVLTFSIGVHVGRALMILQNCVTSIEADEKQQQEEQEEEEIDLGVIDLDAEQEEVKDDA